MIVEIAGYVSEDADLASDLCGDNLESLHAENKLNNELSGRSTRPDKRDY